MREDNQADQVALEDQAQPDRVEYLVSQERLEQMDRCVSPLESDFTVTETDTVKKPYRIVWKCSCCIETSMQLRHCGQFIGLCLGIGLYYGVLTMRNIETETNNEGTGFYNNVWKCSHCPYSETNENLHCVLCTFIGII